ncbi:MAG: hypothetical protein M3458_18850 [Acidobacteriota bacterium]|nr:hypothetical protein [Acidobacteriota bacterium]
MNDAPRELSRSVDIDDAPKHIRPSVITNRDASTNHPSDRLSKQSRLRLAHALIAKSLLELAFVIALATIFYYQTFNPYFRGAVDVADARRVAGWVVDERTPAARVEVQLYINGRFVSSDVAAEARPDVRLAGRAGDDWHGFNFGTPPLPNGSYEARVYAMHESGGGLRRVSQLIGQPRRFQVEAAAASSGDDAGVNAGRERP